MAVRTTARVRVLGFPDPALHHHRSPRRHLYQQGLRHPGDRARRSAGLRRGPVHGHRAGRAAGLHHHPGRGLAAAPGPLVPVLRLAHQGGVDHPVHDRAGDDHAARLPRGAGQHRRLPVRQGRVRLALAGRLAAAARHQREHLARDGLPARECRGDHGVRRLRHLLQAPAHRDGTAERRVLAPPACAGRSRRAASQRPGANPAARAADLEAAARHADLHRMRPVPVRLPGVEQRPAALAQAAHHGPAGRADVGRDRLARPARHCRQRRQDRRCRRSGDQPGCAVVLHHVRCLRRAVPGRYRARRHDRAPAPPACRRGSDRARPSSRYSRATPSRATRFGKSGRMRARWTASSASR